MVIDLDQILDYVQDAKGTFGKEDDPLGYVAAVLEDVPLIVAELRVARRVIDEVRLQSRPHAYLRRALAAYDEVAGPREATAKQPTEAQPSVSLPATEDQTA